MPATKRKHSGALKRKESEKPVDRPGSAAQFPAMSLSRPHAHSLRHAFGFLNPRLRDGLTLYSRRSVLKASLVGLAGLTLPGLLRRRAEAATAGQSMPRSKAVILLWMTGGPSHI